MTEQAQQATEAQETTQDVSDAPAPWYGSAPDEVKGYIQNKGWTDDPLKAVNSYRELEKFRGASEDQLLKLPKDPADTAAYDAIWNKLGRPESPEKYSVSLPDNVQVDDARLKHYAGIAHKAGITQKQFEQIASADAEYWSGMVKEQEQQIAAQQKAEYDDLVKKWGPAAAEREELSRRGLRASLPQGADAEALVKKIESAIGTAATLEIFANIGEKVAKESRIIDGGDDRPFGYTREQAVADRASLMSELKADRERLDAYNRGVGKDYDKMARINKIIAGG